MIEITKEELNQILDFTTSNYDGEWEFNEITGTNTTQLVLSNVNLGYSIIGDLKDYEETDDKITVSHNIIFNIDLRYGVSFGESDLEKIYCGDIDGWDLECHTDTGDFDAEKGAMTGFECSIYYDNEYLGSGSGRNYYTAVGGVRFYDNIDFEIPEKKEPIDRYYIMSLFNDKHNSDDDKVDNLINYIQNYFEDE